MENKSKYLRIIKVGEKYRLFNIKQDIDLGFTIERVRIGRLFMHWCLVKDDIYFSNGCLKEISAFITKLYSKKDVQVE